MTEIETKIISNLFENALGNYKEAWQSIADIEPEMTEFEVNPQFVQMVSPNETVVVISLNTQIGEISGVINLCIPHIVLSSRSYRSFQSTIGCNQTEMSQSLRKQSRLKNVS